MLLRTSLVVVRAAACFCRRGLPDASAQALALARCAAGAVPFKAAVTPNGPPLDAKPHTFGFVAGAARRREPYALARARLTQDQTQGCTSPARRYCTTPSGDTRRCPSCASRRSARTKGRGSKT